MHYHRRKSQSEPLLIVAVVIFSIATSAARAQSKPDTNAVPNCVITGGTNNYNDCPTIINRYYVKDPNRGKLVPESKALAPSVCGVTKPSLNVYVGSNVYIYPIIPSYIFTTPEGPSVGASAKDDSLYINLLQVFDDTGQNVVHFDANGYWVLPTARLETPDKSTLEVYDYHDQLIFGIRFFNPNAVQIIGTFHHDGKTFVVRDTTVITGPSGVGTTISGKNCQAF